MELLRPRQWVKNVFVLLAPLAVAPATLSERPGQALAALIAFIAASASVYVLNDWMDRHRDRAHPRKRRRPLADGRIGPGGALALGAACLAVLAVAATLLPVGARYAVAGYLALNLLYCLALKHHSLVDISVVAAGFLLRAVAGCLAVAAPLDPALLICVYCACLLLSLGKRRHELAAAHRDGRGTVHRPALAGYSLPLLDQLMVVLVTASLIGYELHVLSLDHPNSAALAVVTVPFTVFALCRYLQLVTVERGGGEPGRDVLRDRPLVINAVLWLLCLTVGRLL
ncbi:UbiA prenyltransferase family protein [Streptomyces sp. ST2-7A]|uniref:UbiA prenyltransferase family protein n=1 Tax=Streptomyces sp. ST2-7A TaxID=2907214 RepID=UPI001F158062|nr:UbiA prenyltransferase family protein [Streptomyces sp. ST2-7A]MCE7082167.1 UbiA prenyltransferase family protein [Streptomyces sp. ST2-7A]